MLSAIVEKMRKKIKRISIDREAAGIGICFEPLEPRLLLSGSWGAVVDAPSPDSHSTASSEFGPEMDTFAEGPDAFAAQSLLQRQQAPAASVHVDLLATIPALDIFDTDNAADTGEPVAEAVASSHQALPIAGNDLAKFEDAHADPLTDQRDLHDVRELVLINDNVTDIDQLMAGSDALFFNPAIS